MPAKAAAVPLNSSVTPSILLFTGTGTSASDVSAVEAILGANSLTYSTANSSQLNGMSEGSSYGDDAEMQSNYPIVRLTGTTGTNSGKVYYARAKANATAGSSDWSVPTSKMAI